MERSLGDGGGNLNLKIVVNLGGSASAAVQPCGMVRGAWGENQNGRRPR